ncbi:MAG: aldo/keto reductase [Lachnospiraceae bacterium]|nr:aldo/keto reductase [Lachnospiraceae bacterium]
MEYVKLGKSDLEVSRICMGCMGFGDSEKGMHRWTISEEESKKVIQSALEAGINFFDTAVTYQGGTSEQYLGRAISNFSERDKVVIATKFPPRTPQEVEAGISGQEHVQNMLDQSLQHLGMDYIDLYICHAWDYKTPIYDILDGLNQQIKAGKIRYIGISNCYAWQLAKANALARLEGFPEFISVQGHYNLIFREEEREMAGLCKEDNIAMTPYSPLAGGRLSKKENETSKRLQEDDYGRFKYDSTVNLDRLIINRLEEVAENRGTSMTEIALAWLLKKVTSPVVGMTREEQITGAVNAVEIKLSDKEIQYLEELYQPHKLVGVMAQNGPVMKGNLDR